MKLGGVEVMGGGEEIRLAKNKYNKSCELSKFLLSPGWILLLFRPVWWLLLDVTGLCV